MPRKPRSPDARTRAAIEELFNHPPVNDADLARRLESLDAAEARRLLVERLESGKVFDGQGELFVATLGTLGLGRERGRLVEIAVDRGRPPEARAHAMAALSEDDPSQLEAVVHRLSPDDLMALGERQLVELLATIQADPTQATQLGALLEGLPVEARPALLHRLEQLRQTSGTSAAAAYGALLARSELAALRPLVLPAIITECRPDGSQLLTRLRDQTTDADARRAFQGALLRLRTRGIDTPPEPAPEGGRAFLSSCDGQGAFTLLGCFPNPDGTLTVADLCVRAGGDFRGGLVLPRQSRAELDALLDRMRTEASCDFAPVSLAEAAALAREVTARTAASGHATPADCEASLQHFSRVAEATPAPPPIESVEPRRANAAALRRVLARPEYASWFFDAGDLTGSGARLFSARGRGAKATQRTRWLDESAPKLDSPSMRARLCGMARHMARYHQARGEGALASLLAAAAEAAARDVATSPLVRVMLEGSDHVRKASGPPATNFGDPDVRQELKVRFFQDVKAPRGRDLARLDLTEAARACLDGAFSALPGERRPRDDEWKEAAYAIGRHYADLLTGKPGVAALADPERLAELAGKLDRALGKACRLDGHDRRTVIEEVMPNLGGFVDQVCGGCAVHCLSRPRGDVSHVFFGAEHPMMLVPAAALTRAKQQPPRRRR